MARLRRVRRHNGEVEPFRPSRIAATIRAAGETCGESSPELAEELAGVVTLFLEKRFDDESPPSPSDIREMTNQVLVETGHSQIAAALGRLEEAPGAAGRGSPEVMVIPRPPQIPSPFDRARLVQSILDETRLSEADAEDVSRRVETWLSRTGRRRVDTSLLLASVDVELAACGAECTAAPRQLFGVSRRRLRNWLEAPPGRAHDSEVEAAAAVLEDFALDTVHDVRIARAHRDGRLHITGLGQPQRVERVFIDLRGPLFADCATSGDFLLELVSLLQSVRPLVRDSVVLRGFTGAFARVRKGIRRRGIGAFVDRLLHHLLKRDVHGRGVLPRVTLEVEVPHGATSGQDRAETLVDVLLDRLDRSPRLSGRLGLVFVLRDRDGGPWADTALFSRLLIACRRHVGVALRLLRSRDEEHEDEARVDLDVGSVAVNIPHALALAGARDLDAVSGALRGAIHLATDALFERYWFLRRSAPQTLRGVITELEGGGEARIDSAGQRGIIQLWGLPQAVSFLGPDDPAGVIHHILACVDYLAGEERDSAGLQMRIGGVTDTFVRRRFLESLTQLLGRLDDDALSAAVAAIPEDAPPVPLTPPLLSEANRVVLRAPCIAHLDRGLPLPARGDDSIGGGSWLARLVGETELGYLELEEHREGLEQQGQLFPE